MAWNHPARLCTLVHVCAGLFLAASLHPPLVSPSSTTPPPPGVGPRIRHIGVLLQHERVPNLTLAFQHAIAYANRHIISPKANIALKPLWLPSQERMDTALDNLCSEIPDTDVVVAIGGQKLLSTVSLVTNQAKLPTLSYNTGRTHVMIKSEGELELNLAPSRSQLARGLVKILEDNDWFYASVILSESYALDGFVETFRELTFGDKKWHVEDKIRIYTTDSDNAIDTKLNALLENKSRVIILHCDIETARRVFRVARSSSIVGKGYAWIITEDVMTDDPLLLQIYPQGILAITNDYSLDYRDLVFDCVSLIARAVNNMFKEHAHDDISTGRRSCISSPTQIQKRTSFQLYRYIHQSSIVGKTGNITFDTDGYRELTNFNIYNLIQKNNRNKFWKKIGWYRNNTFDVTTIVWPGNTLSGPITNGSRILRVVTNIVEPFVMDQAANHGKCITAFPCLKVQTSDKLVLDDIFRDYDKGVVNHSRPYIVRCCQGLSIMLLDKLARDLKFRYQLYIVADGKYGSFENNSWNGLVGDVASGAAHLAVAAFSITNSRSSVIDFSTPYFYSGFSILVAERARQIPLDAFLEPFDGWLWFGIVIAATIAAITMAIFEWNSPFGLNPWGRKRKTNYTLGSSLNMVYAILFQHTIKTKSPKAWPSKVLQNFWAAVSIVIYSSYTANLAAFLAGKSTGVTVKSIHDPKLQYMTVSAIRSSAVEAAVRKFNLRFSRTLIDHFVPDSDIGVDLVKNFTIDAYLDDTPILEYARATMDNTCVLKLVGQGFGDDGYGIGMEKNSWLKTPISQKILQYHESGFIEDLKNVFFIRGHCNRPGSSGQLSGEAHSMKFAQHAGLYLMMGVSVILCVWLLFAEHAVFKWLVPYWRRKPARSFWKTQAMMFWSQRLFRIITSEELVSPHTSAKEMMEVVRNRDFTKLFQKSVKKQEKQARNRKNLFNVVEQMQWKQRRDDRLHAEASLQEQDPSQDSDNSATPVNLSEPQAATPPLAPLAATTDKSIDIKDDWPANWRREWIGCEEEELLKNDHHKHQGESTVDTISSLYKNCHINASFSSQDDIERDCATPIADAPGCSPIADDMDLGGYKYTEDDDYTTNYPLHMRDRGASTDSMESLYSQGNPDKCKSGVAFIEGASGGHCYHRLPQEYLPNGMLSMTPNGEVFSRDVPLSMAFNVQPKLQPVSNFRNIATHLPQSIKTLPLKDNRVKSNLLNKSRYLDTTGYIANDITSSLDDFSKEELFEMWRSSERELTQKLNQTMNEKRLLEQRLAVMTPFTDV